MTVAWVAFAVFVVAFAVFDVALWLRFDVLDDFFEKTKAVEPVHDSFYLEACRELDAITPAVPPMAPRNHVNCAERKRILDREGMRHVPRERR